MLKQIFIILIGLACFWPLSSANGDNPETALVPKEHHEWGRFPAGSWKRVRLVTEKLDAEGKVVNQDISETTTTLVNSSGCLCTLRVDTIVEVGGKRFAKPQQTITQSFDGAHLGRLISPKSVSAETVIIGERKLPSRVQSWTVQGQRVRLSNRLFYCGDVAPYVLKREITAVDPTTQEQSYRTTAEVIALDVPHKIQGQVKKTSQLRTVHQSPQGKTVTIEVRSEQVPGGFVSHTSKRYDSQKRLTHRSTLELLDYFVPSSGAFRP